MRPRSEDVWLVARNTDLTKMCDECGCIIFHITNVEKWRCSTECHMALSVLRTVQKRQYLWPALHERSSDDMQSVFVSSVLLSQLWSKTFDPGNWITVLFWSAFASSRGTIPLPPVPEDRTQPSPPLPPPRHCPRVGVSPLVVPPEPPRPRHFSPGNQSFATAPHTASDLFCTDDGSARSTIRSSSK